MGTSKTEIGYWFDRGVKEGYTHMLIMCDSFDYEDYPKYAKSEEEARKIGKSPGEMQRVMEVYHLEMDKKKQLNAHDVFNYTKEI